jgi:hypothetical protein
VAQQVLVDIQEQAALQAQVVNQERLVLVDGVAHQEQVVNQVPQATQALVVNQERLVLVEVAELQVILVSVDGQVNQELQQHTQVGSREQWAQGKMQDVFNMKCLLPYRRMASQVTPLMISNSQTLRQLQQQQLQQLQLQQPLQQLQLQQQLQQLQLQQQLHNPWLIPK